MAQATPDGDTTRSSSQNTQQSDTDRSTDFSAFEGTRPVA